MSTYILTAKLDGSRKRTATVVAENDLDATMQATSTILRLAHRDKQGPWAVGAIELADPRGLVIHSMDAK